LAHAAGVGVDASLARSVPDEATATYLAVHDSDGELCVSVADMGITKHLSPAAITALAGQVQRARLVVVDGNLEEEAFTRLARLCGSYKVPLFFEPTSDPKSTLPVRARMLPMLTIIKPNLSELIAILKAVVADGLINEGRAVVEDALARAQDNLRMDPAAAYADTNTARVLASALQRAMASTHPHGRVEGTSNSIKSGDVVMAEDGTPALVQGKHVLLSLGPKGVLWVGPVGAMQDCGGRASCDVVADDGVACRSFASVSTAGPGVVNTSGSGDSFCAGVVHGLLGRLPLGQAIELGLRAAALSVACPTPVPQVSMTYLNQV